MGKYSVSFFLVLFMSIFLISPPRAGAITLQVDASGQLTGALGVDVLGVDYDVSFLDGSCIDLFSGCDDSSDFLFNTFLSASAATSALMNQVFVDGPAGLFDSQPFSTLGCSHPNLCGAVTPFNSLSTLLANALAFNNRIVDPHDSVNGGITNKAFDSSVAGGTPTFVWAVWDEATGAAGSSSPAPVPEPSTIILLGSGLAGVFLVHRRKRRQEIGGR